MCSIGDHEAFKQMDIVNCPFCLERIGNNRHRIIEKSVQFVEDHTLALYCASISVMLAFFHIVLP